MLVIKLYQCKNCNQIHTDSESCTIHEKQCETNSKIQGCTTCALFYNKAVFQTTSSMSVHLMSHCCPNSPAPKLKVNCEKYYPRSAPKNEEFAFYLMESEDTHPLFNWDGKNKSRWQLKANCHPVWSVSDFNLPF